ncbi:MAG: cation transporter [Bradyrhizobium sp.]|nr:cation transporter [Bradyrhizobium sp.]
MADGSGKVVYWALTANVLVAAAKYIAAAGSGSSAMLTEAIHSTADCANQMLLLIGVRRGRMPPDPSHPFGYGMEIYFWTFVVGVLVLLAGGAFSIYQGLSELAAPEPIRSPLWNLLVLLIAAIFEGSSFVIGYREYRRVAAIHVIPGVSANLVRFIRWSKDPSLYETLLEDGAALTGIAIAAAGTIASAWFGYLEADGIASLLIGAVLILVGFIILAATRSLIAGEAAAPTLLHDIERSMHGQLYSDDIADLVTLHLGPDRILIAVTLRQPKSGDSERKVAHEIERRLKAVDPRIVEVLFRFADGPVPPGSPVEGG